MHQLFWYREAEVPAEVCRKIIQEHIPGLREATVYSNKANGGVANTDKRRSKVNFRVSDEAKNICDMYVREANRESFGVDLGGYSTYQFTAYDYADLGCYGWHVDSYGTNAFARKLSCIVLLSDPDDYEGGELQIGYDSVPVKPAQGTVVVFPSPVIHQVLPVTQGYRFTLVSWAEGPQWR